MPKAGEEEIDGCFLHFDYTFRSSKLLGKILILKELLVGRLEKAIAGDSSVR